MSYRPANNIRLTAPEGKRQPVGIFRIWLRSGEIEKVASLAGFGPALTPHARIARP